MGVGAAAMAGLAWWLVRRKRAGQPALLDADLFRFAIFRLGISGQMLQNIALGGMMIALPVFLQMVLEYNALETGLTIAPLSLSMFAVAVLAGRRAGKRRPSRVIQAGFAATSVGILILLPLTLAGCGFGLLVSQLNNYTLSPISEERVSEAAGVNSAAGSFGLSFGLASAGAIMLATLSLAFTDRAQSSDVLPAAQQEQVAQALEDDAEVMSDTQLQQRLEGQPEEIQQEILRINDDTRPLALQVALLVPILAGLFGSVAALRMIRQPDPTPNAAVEQAALA
jgi:hypothetical protein